jgi:glycerol 3-phosphatase-2
VIDLIDTPGSGTLADGFLLLSQARWTPAVKDRLARALAIRPRPLVVANPDLVAARGAGLTQESGAFAHDLVDRLGLAPVWFGKPFGAAFDEVTLRPGGLAPCW